MVQAHGVSDGIRSHALTEMSEYRRLLKEAKDEIMVIRHKLSLSEAEPISIVDMQCQPALFAND